MLSQVCASEMPVWSLKHKYAIQYRARQKLQTQKLSIYKVATISCPELRAPIYPVLHLNFIKYIYQLRWVVRYLLLRCEQII